MPLRLVRLSLVAAAVLAASLCSTSIASAGSLSVSVSGSDGGSCSSAAPCRSVGRAYQVAQPGDVVVVGAGSYGSQTVPFDASKTSSADVVVEPASGASVSFSGLNVEGRHVTVRGIATGFVDVEKGSTGNAPSDVTVVGGRGSGVFIGGGTSDVSILGGSYGQYENAAPVKVQGSPAPTRITFDGVDFHDAIRTDSSAHLECMYAADVQYFTVRNSTFRNCAIYDLIFTNLSGVNPAHLVIENNVFDSAGSHGDSLSKGYYSVAFYQWVTALNDVLMRNNTFYQDIQWQAGNPTNVRATNNVFPSSTCAPGVTYSHNVSTGKACGSGDKVVSGAMGQFVDPASYDFHLKSGAGAIDAGDPADSPSTDADGHSRPAGIAPDAGAYEYGSVGGPPPADTTAPDTTITSGPSGSTTSPAASFTFVGSDDTTAANALTFQCALDGGPWSACSSPQPVSGLGVGSHTFTVRAIDAAGNTDPSPAAHTWTIANPPPPDTTAPDTAIASGPTGTTTATTASVSFTGSDDTTPSGSLTFECTLDGGAWSACSSPKSYNGLAAGSHSFGVRAKDAAGNVDSSPATRTWTVTAGPPPDTTAPDTSITSGPSGSTTARSASVTFSGSDDTTPAGSLGFECSLDGASYAVCTSPKTYSGLVLGGHSVRVRARDAAGNVDASAASISWTVVAPDTTAPQTTITAEPAATALSSDATFAFVGSDDVTTPSALSFTCKLDDGPWQGCESPTTYRNLALLGHVFAVRAQDVAGNVDPTPASFSWTVVAPSLPQGSGTVPGSPAPPAVPVVLSAPETTPAMSPTTDAPDAADRSTAAAPSLTVGFAAPAPGAQSGGRLAVKAVATGAGARVKRVEFWLDSTRIGKDPAAPYALVYRMPASVTAGNHTLSVRAYDAAGRVASAAMTIVRTGRGGRLTATRSGAWVASVSTSAATGGGTDLTGGSSSGTAVVATLARCATEGAHATPIRVTVAPQIGHPGGPSGHADGGRLCVVRLSPATSSEAR